MLENYSKKGMYVNWPIAEGGLTKGNGGEMNRNVQTLDVLGHKKYLYFPFVPNAINYAASKAGGQDLDVISYNFTGCLMAAYTRGGVRRVCHISTGTGQDCKAGWNIIKKNSIDVVEFKPSDGITLPSGHGDRFGCYGLITSDNKCYSITVAFPSGSKTFIVVHQKQMI